MEATGTPEETVLPGLWARQNGLFSRYGFSMEIKFVPSLNDLFWKRHRGFDPLAA